MPGASGDGSFGLTLDQIVTFCLLSSSEYSDEL
jgi:hypothetical protein